jgi:hypothetical protein
VAHRTLEARGVALDIGGGGLIGLAGGELQELRGVGDAGGGAVDFLDVRA